jgi:hypothetical protein
MLKSAWEFVTERGRHPQRIRKIQLYLAACCRQFWDELSWISRMTTELAEEVADQRFAEEPLARLVNYVANSRPIYPGPLTLEVKVDDLLAYIAEGVLLCYEQQCEAGEMPVGGTRDYERYLIEAGFLQSPKRRTTGRVTWCGSVCSLTFATRLIACPKKQPSPPRVLLSVPRSFTRLPSFETF